MNRVTRKNVDEIQIVEITESGCDYNDFVLIDFSKLNAVDNTLEKLVNQYRSQNTTCVVGFGNGDFGHANDFFDLVVEPLEQDDFETLVELFNGCRTGRCHIDPQDFANYGHCSVAQIFSAVEETFEKTAEKIVNKIEQNKGVAPNKEIYKIFMTIFGDENVSMSTMKNVMDKIVSCARKDCEIMWNISPSKNSNCKVVCLIVKE